MAICLKEDDVKEDGLMNDAYSVAVGKVKWFDPARRQGVIGTVAGGSYFFECGEGEPAASSFEPGKLVTFSQAAAGQLATGVQPI